MTVLELATSPDDAVAALPDMRALYEEALASYGPPGDPVEQPVTDSSAQWQGSVRAGWELKGRATHIRLYLGRVEAVLTSPLPDEYREARRLSSRKVTPDRAEAQGHAKRRDELGTQLLNEFNRAAQQLNAWFERGTPDAAGELVSLRSSPAAPTQQLGRW